MGKEIPTSWSHIAPCGKVLSYLSLSLCLRDGEFNNIVNVVPLEGGFAMVKKPKDFGGLILQTLNREFVFKFGTANELVHWYHQFQSVISKEIKIKKYTKRVKE